MADIKEFEEWLKDQPPNVQKSILDKDLPNLINTNNRCGEIIESADKEFDKLLAFDKKDWAFFALAITLQVVRQYILTDFKVRLDDKTAADQTKGHSKESSDRKHRWYHPSLDEIATNPVPFDAMMGSKIFGEKLSGNTHRYRTLGHDPILGYVFGTMNILTSTLTTSELASYHIKTREDALQRNRDCLTHRAKTSLVVKYALERTLHEGNEGRIAFGSALLKEHIHLRSDVGTKKSLPLPIISVFDAKLAEKLANYGLDVQNVKTIEKQAALSIFINWVVAALHLLCKTNDEDEQIYAAKTKKMLMISNIAATSSNLVYSIISQNYRKTDIGGSIVTIFQTLSSCKTISDLRIEFRNQKIRDAFLSDLNAI